MKLSLRIAAGLFAAALSIAPAAAQFGGNAAPLVPLGGGGGSGGLGVSLPSSTPALASQAYTTTSADNGHLLQVSTTYANSTITLMSAVTAGNGAYLCVQKADFVAQAVTGAANNGSGLIRIATTDTSKYVTGQQYQIGGVTGTVEANGAWHVTVIDSTHIDLIGSAFVNAFISGGTIGNVKVTVQSTEGGTVDRAWLMAGPTTAPPWPGDNACFQSNGSTWQVIGRPEILPQKWWWAATDANGWTRPPLMARLHIYGIGAGGGGGSGARRALAGIRTGGAGGSVGLPTYRDFNAYDLPTSVGTVEQVTVGAGGTGGAAVTVDTTNGNTGNTGIVASWGTTGPLASGAWIQTRPGGGGGAGSTANATGFGVATGGTLNWFWPAVGANSSSTTTCSSFNSGMGGGGGAGGSADAANNQRLPCVGQSSNPVGTSLAGTAGAGGAAGTAGNPGGNGIGVFTGDEYVAGGGGGGGYGVASTAGTAGGIGAFPGGGGGGGAWSDNGTNSGAGGAGGGSMISATSFF